MGHWTANASCDQKGCKSVQSVESDISEQDALEKLVEKVKEHLKGTHNIDS